MSSSRYYLFIVILAISCLLLLVAVHKILDLPSRAIILGVTAALIGSSWIVFRMSLAAKKLTRGDF